MTVREAVDIVAAGEELGKSLAKILHSVKYTEFEDYTDLIQIMVVASNTAIRIIEDSSVREPSL